MDSESLASDVRDEPNAVSASADAVLLVESMGPSQQICRLARQVALVAPTDFTVLIAGETGSGKDLVAKAIHSLSRRRDEPLVSVDCGSIPPTLIESELFGHEKGSFTGADETRAGKFEIACDGTLFLDEISNLPLSVQPNLLRALQEREICRIGGRKGRRVDIRVVAATNEDLASLVEAGKFRRDLYHRLNEFAIHVPPLRERPEDIVYLANRFLDMTNKELHKHVSGPSDAALARLLSCKWPGNVRELRNVIRRAVLLTETYVALDDLGNFEAPPLAEPGPFHHPWEFEVAVPLKEAVQRVVVQVERDILTHVLKRTGGNKAKAARLLRIDYKTIHKKVKDYGISCSP